MTTDFLQVATTTPSAEDAERIARSLAERQLAACVQIVGPIRSIYRWQGAIETSQEWLAVAKTTRAAYAEVEQTILAAHPYDTPEIIATPIVAGSRDYLAWVSREVPGK